MVRKGVIGKNLREIQRLYSETPSTRKKYYYAKLAILELCGWIEAEMDALLQRCSGRCITDTANIQNINKRIQRCYGFGYPEDFRPLLTLMIGLSRLEQIEKDFDMGGGLSRLRSILGKLRSSRNTHAHTYTPPGILPGIDAPSVTISDMEAVYGCMRELERILRRKRF